MEYQRYTAKTVDEAITKACLEFGVTSDRLDYDVVQEPASGFLGIGSKPAIIKARPRTEEELKKEQKAIEEEEKKDQESVVIKALESSERTVLTSDVIEQRAAAAAAKTGGKEEEEGSYRDQRSHGRRDHDHRYERRNRYEREEVSHEPSRPKPERVIVEKSEEKVDEMKQKATDFLNSVFQAMNLTVTLEADYNQQEGALNLTFDGEEMGILIGKRGQTLDSLQYLTSLVVNKGKSDYTRVKLDTEDYRSRRSETLNNLARNIAFKVKKTHRPVALEPMNPYERRVIHSALQRNPFVETYSEGEEPYRHVVVAPKRR